MVCVGGFLLVRDAVICVCMYETEINSIKIALFN